MLIIRPDLPAPIYHRATSPSGAFQPGALRQANCQAVGFAVNKTLNNWTTGVADIGVGFAGDLGMEADVAVLFLKTLNVLEQFALHGREAMLSACGSFARPSTIGWCGRIAWLAMFITCQRPC